MSRIHLAKYIIIRHGDTEYPVLFPPKLQHSDMVPKDRQAVSAGFYQIIDANTLLVGGESTSLNLRSRPHEDAALIRRSLIPTDN